MPEIRISFDENVYTTSEVAEMVTALGIRKALVAALNEQSGIEKEYSLDTIRFMGIKPHDYGAENVSEVMAWISLFYMDWMTDEKLSSMCDSIAEWMYSKLGGADIIIKAQAGNTSGFSARREDV